MQSMVGIIGGADISADIYSTAFEVGSEIARQGYLLVCGGMGGVMEAAAKGCKQAGGLTVGIIPAERREMANPFIDIVIPTGMGIMRNLLVVRSAVGLIAIDGKYGTLSELAFALQLDVPVVGLGTWDVSDRIIPANSPTEAVQKLISEISR